MQSKLYCLMCCGLLLLGGCGGQASQPGPQPIQTDPLPVATTNHSPSLLPAVDRLDTIRASSQLFNSLTILTQSGASVNGSGHLILDAPPGGFAYVVFDLGNQVPGFNIGSVDFTNADWVTLAPAPKVFVGVADYSLGIWRFRQALADGTPANFNSLAPGTEFLSPTNHSYLAIIANAPTLDFGDDIDIQAAAGPGGELPADFTLDFTGMPGEFGQNNAIAIRPDFSGGDILTYCPGNDGGAQVRFAYDDVADAITTTIKTHFDAGNGELLAACNNYRLDYYSDGRLGIGAARTGPNAIRALAETTPGSLTLGPGGSVLTAVDNTVLPVNFGNPQYDYKITAADNPQCLFVTNTGALGYAYYVAGSWGIDTGGPATLGGVSLRLTTTDAIVAYQQSAGGSDTKVVVSRMLQRPLGFDFGSAADVFTAPGRTPGADIAMALGLGNSIHVANFNATLAGNNQLGYSYSDNGVVVDSWDSTAADDGGVATDSVGEAPSIGILSDGTPVIAYYDQTNKSLRLAISTTPDGGNVTGATWDSYRIDTSQFGSEVGKWPALGVIQRTAPDPDKIVVAYGVVDGATTVMRVILLDAPARAT